MKRHGRGQVDRTLEMQRGDIRYDGLGAYVGSVAKWGSTIKIEEAGMLGVCLKLRGQVKSRLVNSSLPIESAVPARVTWSTRNQPKALSRPLESSPDYPTSSFAC